MRIGIEAQRLLRKKKYGIDIVALNLIRNITLSDPKNEYILFTRTGDDLSCLSDLKNIRTVILPALNYADWEQVRLPLAVKRERIDLLLCTGSTAPLLPGVPVVLTVHDVINFERPLFGVKGQSLYQRLGNLYRTVVSRKAMEMAAQIITVSHAERARIVRRFPAVSRSVSVIHNGVDDSFFRESSERDRSSTRERYVLPCEYFLHFGSSDPKKNTEMVIEAYITYAGSVPLPYPLVLTGIGRSRIEKVLRHRNAVQLLDNFITPEYLDHTHLPAVFASARALLFPSTRESFGLPVLESMAAGIPVITMMNDCMQEIAGDSAVVLPSGNSEALSTMMTGIHLGGAKQQSTAISGRERARQFSWQRTAKEYIRAIEDLHLTERGQPLQQNQYSLHIPILPII